MSEDDEALSTLVRVLRGLGPAERAALAAMPETFYEDLGRELVTAKLFGDPGALGISLHHRNHGIVERAHIFPDRERQYGKQRKVS